jgi:uncharacterized membrane protein
LKKIFVFISFIFFNGPGIFKVEAATKSSAEVSATVVSINSVVPLIDLNFGTIIPAATSGTVTVTPINNNTDTRSKTGNLVLAGSDYSAGKFIVKGNGNFYTVDVSPGEITIKNSSNQTMTVNNFTIQSDDYAPGNSQHFRFNNGYGHFKVGARLNVNANQQAGFYEGTYSVIVALH